jgi:hypothetical protein
MDPMDRLNEERHDQVMSAIASVHVRLDKLNGRTRQSELDVAVLSDRSRRANALSWSSLGAVMAGAALYWMSR